MKKALLSILLSMPLMASAEIPQCSDQKIESAVKKLFKQPSANGGLHLNIMGFSGTKETAFYPQANIRLCHAIATVPKGKYFTIDYNISTSGKQYFVQIENAQEVR